MSLEAYIFDDHNQKRQFDAKSLLRVSRALNACGADIGSHNFKYRRLNIRVGNTLDVAISNCMREIAVGEPHSKILPLDIQESLTFLVPNLQGLAPKTPGTFVQKVSTYEVNFDQ